MRLVLLLLPVVLFSCTNHHSITLLSDRTVVLRDRFSSEGNYAEHFGSPAVALLDTNMANEATMVIRDIDSLGNHLADFTKGRFTFTLHGNELTIRAADVPVEPCWSWNFITLVVEQGILEARHTKRYKVLDNYIILKITKKRLRKMPDEFNAVFVLKPVK